MKKLFALLLLAMAIMSLSSCGTYYSAAFNEGFRDGWNSQVTDEYKLR